MSNMKGDPNQGQHNLFQKRTLNQKIYPKRTVPETQLRNGDTKTNSIDSSQRKITYKEQNIGGKVLFFKMQCDMMCFAA